jgi:hypothetical protein
VIQIAIAPNARRHDVVRTIAHARQRRRLMFQLHFWQLDRDVVLGSLRNPTTANATMSAPIIAVEMGFI